MDVLMPQLGETVAEGKITKWFKSAGDAVKPGDNLFEIETDKVSMEVPSITAGTLTEIKVQVGEAAQVGAVVAVIAGEGGAARRARRAPRPKRRRQLRSRPRKRRQRQALGPRVRGDAAARHASRPARLDPFFEVRTPERNFGPAKTRGRHVRHAAGAPARRRERHRSVAHVRAPARTAASSPPTSRPPSPRAAAAPRRMATGAIGRAGQGALPGRRVRGGAARRHARDHRARGWSRPSRPSRISISSPT